jgi:hypothetical protein
MLPKKNSANCTNHLYECKELFHIIVTEAIPNHITTLKRDFKNGRIKKNTNIPNTHLLNLLNNFKEISNGRAFISVILFIPQFIKACKIRGSKDGFRSDEVLNSENFILKVLGLVNKVNISVIIKYPATNPAFLSKNIERPKKLLTKLKDNFLPFTRTIILDR